MRTRTSPRNQDILWRELGGPKPKPAKRDEVEIIEAILADGDSGARFITKRTRGQLERSLQRAKIRRATKAARA